MKARFALIASFFLCSIFAQAQIKEADSLIRQVFIALKTNDSTAFMRLFPDYEHVRSLMLSLADGVQDTAMKRQMVTQAQAITEDQYKSAMVVGEQNTFRRIVERGKSLGLNWSTATLDHFGYAPAETPFPGAKTLSGPMLIKDGGKDYELAFGEILWRQALNECLGMELVDIHNLSDSVKDVEVPVAKKKAPVAKKPASSAAKKPVKKPAASTKKS